MTSETAASTAGSNDARYWSAPFNWPEHYPVGLTPDPAHYQPSGAWLGRLLLPAVPERSRVVGVWLEVHHAPAEHHALVGQKVRQRWEHTPALNAALWGAARSVVLDEASREAATAGAILAERVAATCSWLSGTCPSSSSASSIAC